VKEIKMMRGILASVERAAAKAAAKESSKD